MPASSPRRQPTRQPAPRSTRPSRRDPLRALHDAEVYLILEYLEPEDIVCAGAVCRQWKAYIDGYISTTAMRRSFPRVWNEHKHRRPLNQLELAREYRRQACESHALRTGKATAGRSYSKAKLYNIREPYVAWSDGKLRFNVENLFSARAAWQGTDALFCTSTTKRLVPGLSQIRINYLCLATELDLLFLRVAPCFPDAATYKYEDLMYSIPKDGLVWSKTRWADDDDRHHTISRTEVGRRVYLSDSPDPRPFVAELQFVAEDLATGTELYCRSWADVHWFELHILETQDLIVLYQSHRASIVAGDTGDILRVVRLGLTNTAASVVQGSDNLVFSFRTNFYGEQYHFYHFRRHSEGGADGSSDHHGSGGQDSIEELQRMYVCRATYPSVSRMVFQRNMRDCLSLVSESSAVALRLQWRINVLREEAASAACVCVQDAGRLWDHEPPGLVPLVPFEAATPPSPNRLSHYPAEDSALITLPVKSSSGRGKAKTKAKAKANTKDGRYPRRPFHSETDSKRALLCRFLDEHHMVFTSRSSDLCILSFRAEW
ncbi:MAG: hypothetical protein M1826_003601 [Phylliscum demangeonii]|nr:MAG: hypothetical protein M1826_003601 [Phylliscum demangeonii]